MRYDATKIKDALLVLAAEQQSLRDVSEMEDAGELHGTRPLDEDETEIMESLWRIAREGDELLKRL